MISTNGETKRKKFWNATNKVVSHRPDKVPPAGIKNRLVVVVVEEENKTKI